MNLNGNFYNSGGIFIPVHFANTANATRASIISDTISSRRGRKMLAHSMTTPIFSGSGLTPPECECVVCALANSKDCEKIRPTKEDGECFVPHGKIYVWDEKPA